MIDMDGLRQICEVVRHTHGPEMRQVHVAAVYNIVENALLCKDFIIADLSDSQDVLQLMVNML